MRVCRACAAAAGHLPEPPGAPAMCRAQRGARDTRRQGQRSMRREKSHIENHSAPRLGCVLLWQRGSACFVEHTGNDVNSGTRGKVSAIGHGLSASEDAVFGAGNVHLQPSLYSMRDAGDLQLLWLLTRPRLTPSALPSPVGIVTLLLFKAV